MADSNFISLDNINMPYSLDAEQSVLGCILADPSTLSTASLYVTPDSFFIPQHKAVFSAMLSSDAMGNKIDALVILDMLVQQGVYDRDAGRRYLFELAQMVPSTSNVEMYAKIVREHYYKRTLIEVSTGTIENVMSNDSTADELLNDAEQKIYDIRKGKTSDAPSKLGDIIVNDVFDSLRKLTSEDAELYKGYSTGFSDLDNVLTGLNKSDLIIVGARPGMGKTSFALNVARNVSLLSGRKVLFFSLEMSKEQLASRVLGTEARVSSSKMRSGQINTEEWKRLGTAAGALSKCELYFDDSSNITVPEMKAKVRKLGGVDCVMVDYLGLVKGVGKSENRVNEVSEITRSLKMMAKDLKIPVLVACQLSRGTEARGKSHKPQLADLRESGSIEQDADIVLMLYRSDYYSGEKEPDDDEEQKQDEINRVSVIVTKNRHGSLGEVEFAWDGEHTLFLQIEKYHNEA
ncbi:MAG: replicative DNA helicase [Clostridiales bacterium]|nr:replicative DNA helicase [Clostridiales bacterium]